MSHVQRDGSDRTAAARRTFRERFDHYADPDGILHPEERTRRGDKLWRSWWSYLRYHSAMGTKAITLPEWLAQYAPGAERVAER